MTNTLIIYDNVGYILLTQQGEPVPREPLGIPFLWVEIPQGKKIRDGFGVDVSHTPHQALFDDIPKSKIEMLEEDNMALKIAIAELADAQKNAKTYTQIALAELAESLVGGE